MIKLGDLWISMAGSGIRILYKSIVMMDCEDL